MCIVKLTHRYYIGISSPVLEAMFYGPLSTNEEIIVTDIELKIFQLLLNYIYTVIVSSSYIPRFVVISN